MLDPGLLATVSFTSTYVLADSSDQVVFLRPESVILLVDSLYAEAVEAVKSWAALPALPSS
jgi:hypothetical protein